jgi:hypothetical protein
MNTRRYRTVHLDINKGKGAACNKKGYGCRWKWDTIEHFTKTQIRLKEQLVVRNDMGVDDHKTLSNITLRHKNKLRNSL